MTITLRALLAREDFALLLVEGPPEALGAPVTWGYSTDLLDPTPFLRGGELILTTGQQLMAGRELPYGEDDDPSLRAYAERLAGAGACGLVYTLQHPEPAWEQRLRRACRAAGLVLVRAPFSTPFIRISEAVSEALGDRRLDDLRVSLRGQQALTLAALEDEPIRAIVRELSLLLGSQVAVRGDTGRWLATTPAHAMPTWAASLLDQWRAERSGRSRPGGRIRRSGARVTEQDGQELLAQPLHGPAGAADLGQLVVLGPAPTGTGEQRRLLVNTAAAMTRLALESHPPGGLDRDEVERLALEGLLAGEGVVLHALLAHTGALLRGPFLVVVADRPLRRSRGRVVVHVRAGEQRRWVAVAEESAAPTPRPPAAVVRIDRIDDVRDAVDLAARRLDDGETGVAWIGFERAILDRALWVDPGAVRVVRRLADDIAGAERGRRGQDLLRTFEAWNDNGLNWQRTADLLHVHRNTVVRRVRELGATLGLDLERDAAARTLVAAAGRRASLSRRPPPSTARRSPGSRATGST